MSFSEMSNFPKQSRRQFIRSGTIGAGAVLSSPLFQGVSLIASERTRPTITHGLSSGDVTQTQAVVWSRCDRPAQFWVDLSTTREFAKFQTIKGSLAQPLTDFNAKAFLDQLMPGTDYFYRIYFESVETPGTFSHSQFGRFRTASSTESNIRFCWSGDTAGQGFGIDPARGGMTTYAAILERKPDFFVHSGDLIYADNPMSSEVQLEDGTIWKNLLIEAKTKVAETTDEFRQNFYYNLMDHNVRAFLAEVPVIQQWDDHEVVNNWYPGEHLLDDDRYKVKDVNLLAHRARTAYFDCNPVRPHVTDPRRIYRKIERGPLLDLFVIDLRSYRGPNTHNHQPKAGRRTDFLGENQLRWLKSELKASTATWKIICSDMPIGLVISEWQQEIYENGANAEDGPPLGRELELASLFEFIAEQEIANTHFITADVHYCASHYYSPETAGFKNFKPFWEFVSGPLHAGSFGPNQLDLTFGPELKFLGIPQDMKPFRPPSDGFQFFGEIEIDGSTQALTVRHINSAGKELWSHHLDPEA
ncbi:MAG: alkaline phosphatase D family protein [Verrucomicrobiota bacterium]